MTAIYDPWHVQPRQLPSNLRRVAQGRGEGRTLSVQVSNPAPATNSPPPVTVIAVRCKTEPNAFRIRLPATSQANPMADDNWRGGRSLTWRSLLALYRRGDRHADSNLGCPLGSGSFQSRIQILQEAVRSFSKCFKRPFVFLAHGNDPRARRRQGVVEQ